MGLVFLGLQPTLLASSLTFFPRYRSGSELVKGRTEVRHKTVQKMANASNEWRMLIRCQKPLEMHLQRRKWVSKTGHPKKTRARIPQTQFSRPRVKSGRPTISSLCFVLVISLLIFGVRTPTTSTHTPCKLPDTFLQGIGREASSLEGEHRCDPKRSKRWPMLPTSGECSFGVRNH